MASLEVESEHYKQRNIALSHVFRRGVKFFGDGDRLCRLRVINNVEQYGALKFYPCGKQVRADGPFGQDSHRPSICGNQGTKILENSDYKKWVSDRIKLRRGLDGLGLSNGWLRSKKRTALERDILMKDSCSSSAGHSTKGYRRNERVSLYETPTIDNGKRATVDDSRTTMDDGRTTIDDGRATLIDGGRTTIDDGKRTVIDGGKRTVINDSTMDNGSNPVIDESRRTAIDDDSKRKFFYGTHQQLAKEYRKKESQQLSKLLSLCAKEMIPMTDNFIEKAFLSPADKSKAECLMKLPDPSKLQSCVIPKSCGDVKHFILYKKKPHNITEIMKLSTGVCSVKRVDCWFTPVKCKNLLRKRRPFSPSVTTMSSFWPGNRDNTLYVDELAISSPNLKTPSRCAVFHIVNHNGHVFSVQQVSSWSQNENGYVQLGSLDKIFRTSI